MRHWLYGGRTDLANLVLLCDADHGLVHDLDLVLSRRGGALIVLDREGRRVWGRTDAVFTDGLPDHAVPDDAAQFLGVHPFDDVAGRRPTPHAELRLITCGGEFDPDARSYRDNVVVSAVRAD